MFEIGKVLHEANNNMFEIVQFLHEGNNNLWEIVQVLQEGNNILFEIVQEFLLTFDGGRCSHVCKHLTLRLVPHRPMEYAYF